MPEKPSPIIQNRIRDWLNRWGFDKNPFEDSNAEQETYVKSIFVDTGKLEWIYGDPDKPQTVLFFANRGCGKTAHRRRIEENACPIDSSGKILVIVYNKFSHWRQPNSLMPEDHIKVILQEGLYALFRTISDCKGEYLLSSADEQVSNILRLCHQFASKLLTPTNLDKYIQKTISQDMAQDSRRELYNSIVKHRLEDFLRDKNVSHSTRFFAKFSDLISTNENIETIPSFAALELFVDIVLSLGLKAVYVLVDAVDELPQTLSWLDFLPSLLSDLRIMEIKGLAFKYFLPADEKSQLFSMPGIRPDKLDYAELVWTSDDLRSLIASRLKAFNSLGIDSLKPLCEPALGRIIDNELILKSGGVPRNLLQLANRIFWVHCRDNNPKEFLTVYEWEVAHQEVSTSVDFVHISNRTLLLEIGKKTIILAGKTLSLTKFENRFLLSLANNNGYCDKNEIAQLVYGESVEGYTDQQLSNLVKRLRRKLGDDAKKPTYLRARFGQGFELNNWRITDD